MDEYRTIEVESFEPASSSGHRGSILVRPLPGQGVDTDLLVECPRAMVNEYPVGTRFRIRAKLKQKDPHSRPHLYTSYRWSFEVIPARVTQKVTASSEPKRQPLPRKIPRETVLWAIDQYEGGVSHRFGPSTKFDLLHNETRYPPKAIVGLAAGRLTGNPFKPKDYTAGLDSKCFRLLTDAGFEIVRKNDFEVHADELADDETYQEGAVKSVRVNRYERDPDARAACLAHHGFTCSVCKFDFAQTYGDLGDGYIHVHHIVQLSTVGAEYVVNPIVDLRPVCPNCHAMLHRKKKAMTIEELRGFLKRGLRR